MRGTGAKRPRVRADVCPGCAAKDQVIAVLGEQLAYERADRQKLTNELVSIADPMVHARIAYTANRGDAPKPEGGKHPPSRVMSSQVAAEVEAERLSDEQIAKLNAAMATTDEKEDASVAPPPRRAEIEESFTAPPS